MIYDEIVADTTVLVKAIIPPRRKKQDSIYKEQWQHHVIAKEIIQKVENKESIMHIPSIAIVETAAVSARLTGKEEDGIKAANYVQENGHIIYDKEFLDSAKKVAVQTKVSGFDATFIACAQLTNSTLVTDDKNMFDTAIKLGIKAQLLREMKISSQY